MYNCQECLEQLYPFLDRVLDDDEQHLVRQHLGRCNRCAKRFRFEGNMLRLVGEVARATNCPEEARKRILRACGHESDSRCVARFQLVQAAGHRMIVPSASPPSTRPADVLGPTPKRIWPLALLGAAIVLTWLAAVGLAGALWNPLAVYNGAFALTFALYLVATALVLGPTQARPRGLIPLILGVAVLARVVLLASQPALSDDLYRYVWDGKVQSAGINPYQYAPDSPELASLRDELWPPINQKWQRTPYPPAAELVFAATYGVAGSSVKARQVVATLADLLVIAALLALLARLKLPSERVLIYAWGPLPVLHFAHSAHNDALMIAPLLVAVLLASGSRVARVTSGVALAFAALTKLLPLLLLPALLRRWRVAGGIAFAATTLALLAPFARGGNAVLAGLGAEAGQAVFNDSLHLVLVHVIGLLTGSASLVVTLLTAAILGGVALALAWRGQGDTAGLARMTWILLGLAILLNAVVEPWYLTWMLPFAALYLRPGRARWPFAATPALGWLWLSGAVQLTDLHYAGLAGAGVWPLIRLVEYGPLFGLLVLSGGQWAMARFGPWRRQAPDG